MSKVNRRQEIKEKEAFQLRFQLALSEKNKAIAGWLKPQAAEQAQPDSDKSDHDSFLNLPIVSSGASLAELEKQDDISTMGDFLNPQSVPQKLASKTRDTSGSQAMKALMNRMRNDSRRNVQEKRKVQKPVKRRLELLSELKPKVEKKVAPKEEEEDSEEEAKQRSVKKKPNLFEGKKKRPF